MNDYVLDASAILALLNDEKGADIVKNLLPRGIISSVNLSEVVTRLVALGMPEPEIRQSLAILGLEIIPFDDEQAIRAGFLFKITQPLGLSLGDRACLSLAMTATRTALTADRAWMDLDIGILIQLIR